MSNGRGERARTSTGIILDRFFVGKEGACQRVDQVQKEIGEEPTDLRTAWVEAKRRGPRTGATWRRRTGSNAALICDGIWGGK